MSDHIATLTDNQRRSLHLAGRKGGALVRLPGQRVAPDQVAFQTARVLVARGWAIQPSRVLLTTTEGRKALVAPQYDDGLYLHAKLHRGYTTDPRHGPKGEPQVMDKPSTTWQMEAHRAHAEAKLRSRDERKRQANQLASCARSSGKHGWRIRAPRASVTVSQIAA